MGYMTGVPQIAGCAQNRANRAPGARSISANESELISRVIAGAVSSFHELIRPYERSVYLVALSLLRNEADAEEVAQEAFLKVFLGLAKFRNESKFSTWMIQIALNEAKAKLRKSLRHPHDSLDELNCNNDGGFIPKDFADWRDIPSEALERLELRKALKKGLDSLGEKYRTVIILRDVLQCSVAETAKSLRVSESVVKVRLFRARLQMRGILAPGYDGAYSRGAGWKASRPS